MISLCVLNDIVLILRTSRFQICSASSCPAEDSSVHTPLLCSAPIKVVNYTHIYTYISYVYAYTYVYHLINTNISYVCTYTYVYHLFLLCIFVKMDLELLQNCILNLSYIFLQYQYANYTSPDYKHTGKGLLNLQLINQRSDFSFALFSGGLSNVCYLLVLLCYFCS